MASILIENIKAALKRCNIRSVTGWTDSTVDLHGLNRIDKDIANILKKMG